MEPKCRLPMTSRDQSKLQPIANTIFYRNKLTFLKTTTMTAVLKQRNSMLCSHFY